MGRRWSPLESGASQALAVAITVGALGVLCGTLILLAAIVWQVGFSLAPARLRLSTATSSQIRR